LYKQDIERIAAMGVKYYSFSIAWSRILPFALPGTPINQAGLDHYDDVINFILEKGMIPSVTLLHFDTPLQFYGANLSSIGDRPLIGYVNGGYQNETFPDAFVHYAKLVMTHYADRVPLWFTFNEPLLYSYNGVSIDHVIKAHARVFHWYKEELNGTGDISIKFNDNFGVPRDPSNDADVYAANHFNDFQLATFCNPIFLGIDYPEAFKQTIEDYVPLSEEDLAYIGFSATMLGIDPYTATVVAPPTPDSIESVMECASNASNPFRPYCVNQTTVNVYGWDIGYRSQSYVYITPTYLRSYMYYLYNTFKTPILITEFGKPPLLLPHPV
jgi:beta-glucosidase/6-phospho-beta-glucosidase/beta-galactosidase